MAECMKNSNIPFFPEVPPCVKGLAGIVE